MNIVCNACERFMKPYKNGRCVVVHASFGPYQIYSADEYKCDGCQHSVTTAFGLHPISEHFEPNFQKVLENARSTNNAVEVR